jgi:hypothetical protein
MMPIRQPIANCISLQATHAAHFFPLMAYSTVSS